MKPFSAELVAIGTISTPFKTLDDCPKSSRACTSPAQVEVFEKYAAGLSEIDACSHILLFYWLDQAVRDSYVRNTPIDNQRRGVFAIRSPARPNPIGLSVVRLNQRRGRFLDVSGVDCLDGTALIDIKPYIPAADIVEGATVDWWPAS